jgi:hypothetical protein
MSMDTTMTVWEYDGILALLDLATYTQEKAWVALDPDLIDHFEAERAVGRAFVWQTSELGGAEYRVDVRSTASSRDAIRELNSGITVTDGVLHLVNYTDITTAAEDPGRLPDRLSEEWRIELENGEYTIRVRQFFDPTSEVSAEDGEASFELVITPGAPDPATVTNVDALFWRH